MRTFGDALKASSQPDRDSVIARLRQLHFVGKADLAWRDDPVVAILLATADVAPALARDVAVRLKIKLPALAGRSRKAALGADPTVGAAAKSSPSLSERGAGRR